MFLLCNLINLESSEWKIWKNSGHRRKRVKGIASEKTRGSVESFSGELKHAWAHSRELETARVEEVRGGKGRNGVVGGPGGIEQRLDEISGIIKST